MYKRATWVYSLPCQNPGLSVDDNFVELSTTREKFLQRDEEFGGLLYRRDRGPIFWDCYVEPSQLNNRFCLSAPVRVDIELTSRCMLQCMHCYFGEKSETDLPLHVLESLLRQLAGMGTVGVQLVGGEPFLHPQLPEIVRVAKANGLKVEVFSSGFGAKPEAMQQARGLVDFLAVDLDGTEATHDRFRGRKGSFQAALRMLDTFACSGTHVDVTMILSRMNLDEIEQVYDVAVAHGARSLNIRLLHPSGEGAKNAELALTSGPVGDSVNARIDALNENGKLLVRKPYRFNCATASVSFFGCPGGKFSITVKPNGDVVKCNVSRRAYGNIYHSSFSEIWRSIASQETYRGCALVQQDVAQCLYAGICGGPCEMVGLDKEYCFSLATK